ncbi:MAG: flagellar motor protein MotB [Pseudopedobacter saltans]|uniref:Flagellar motor protein MotB n=1 Tax=Pseudopedobacter saltans TaxID=151895 RepID=A0A2W5F0B6_9SPHI|nr:MAG: flagellar motor protein MotB [Pseudopedobacter saltans]
MRIKSFLFLFVVLVWSQICMGQKKTNAEKNYDNAIPLLEGGNYDEGLNLLLQSFKDAPNSMNTLTALANTYNEIKQYDSAVIFFEKANTLDAKAFLFFQLNYSVALAGVGRFEEALKYVNQYLAIPNLSSRGKTAAEYRKRNYEFAVDYANKHPNTNYTFAPVNMGDEVNSTFSEYYPSFTIDDSMFVFTRRGEGFREDFMQSFKLPDGNYTKAVPMPGVINEEPSKGAIDIAQDGQWIIFAGNFQGKGFGDFDLYISYKTVNGWSEPVNMGRNINTEYWESSPSLSPDKKSLYFSSNCPSGFGGNDLYVSHLTADGKWTKAINLGPKINTKGDELAPLIHADNESLYFTSSGLPGYGGSDLFMSKRMSDSGWSIPQNLGYPINTIDNEGSLFVAADGITAYYASDRSDSRGDLDLYRFSLRPDVRPLKTLFVSGKIVDGSKNENGLDADFQLVENGSQNVVTQSKSSKTGEYMVTLPAGKDYTFTVKKKGYMFQSELFELSKEKPQATVRKDIALKPIQLNASITLKNILFNTNSYELQPISLIELNTVLELLKENPTLRLQIDGHTDNKGSQAINLPLSTNRAKAVVDFLVKNGIAKDRLQSKGFGDSQPVATNDTEEGRALNRRTDIEVVGM